MAFQATSSSVYVIPVKEQIEPGWLLLLERSLEEAEEADAQAVILDMDTPGGFIDTTREAKTLLEAFAAPVYVHVNTSALSAGAYLALAADGFYMAPGSTIGAAEPVVMGGGEVSEKFISVWETEMESAAEKQGKDPRIAGAMVRKEMSVEGVVEKGELLTLTTSEAENLEFSNGTAVSIDELLEAVGLSDAELTYTSPTLWEDLSGWLINPVVATLLLMMGFFFMIVEILTAGFGVGGFLSLLSFGLYFGGHFFTGVSGWQAIFLFALGIIFLLVEAFVPGFGIFGIGGLIAVFIAIVLAAASTTLGLYMLFISFVIACAAGYGAFKYFQRKGTLKSFILSDSATREAGYSSSEDHSHLLGKKGRTITPMHPSGIVEIEGKRYDTVSEGGYINADEYVEVIKVEGSRILIRKTK
ncbi:MAG: NfeD family protein [Bacillota bacterium]